MLRIENVVRTYATHAVLELGEWLNSVNRRKAIGWVMGVN